jgi:16S rRNA G1207 methylase RsmC
MNGMEGGGRLPARVAELRLLEIARDLPGNKVLAMSQGRGQAAELIAQERPESSVVLWYLDAFVAQLAQTHCQATPQLKIECLDDWPQIDADLALLPLSQRGESELSRDLIQSAYQRLIEGGWLVVSVDNPEDRWVLEQLRVYDKRVKVRPFDDAMVYLVQKSQPLKRIRDFQCELAFRDCDQLIRLVTRPGVFSHRELDNGARQLLDAIDVYPEARLLDIGCGSGSVALGCAMRDSSATVHAVDSNARAVWCTQHGVKMNQLENVTVELSGTGEYGEPSRFDMALANPPYYGDFRIAERFIQAAMRSLRPEGRLVLVTKQPRWYEENLPLWLDDVEVFASRRYHIASGLRPAESRGGPLDTPANRSEAPEPSGDL